MSTQNPTDTTATVIIGQRVRPGCERAFEQWQLELNRAASTFAGFLAAEVNPPTSVQPEWVVVYRFDSIPNVMAWINSATRQEQLAIGAEYFDGPGTQQVLGGGGRHIEPLVTVVVSHHVKPENEDEFLDWQDRLRDAESKFPGFRGTELFRPVAGVQDDWTALYRYDSAADLDRWLVSDERKKLLAEGEKFADFKSRTIDNSFGNWFAFGDNDSQPPPSDVKTSIAVWVGLYPTVVLLSLAMRPLHMPLWLALLVGNLLSSFAMTFLTMPYYVNPLLKNWLRPPPNVPALKSNWRGVGISIAALTIWSVIFYLGTRVFWHI